MAFSKYNKFLLPKNPVTKNHIWKRDYLAIQKEISCMISWDSPQKRPINKTC